MLAALCRELRQEKRWWIMGKGSPARFLCTHLLRWVPDFLQILLQHFFWGFTCGDRVISGPPRLRQGIKQPCQAGYDKEECYQGGLQQKRGGIHSAIGFKNLKWDQGIKSKRGGVRRGEVLSPSFSPCSHFPDYLQQTHLLAGKD